MDVKQELHRLVDRLEGTTAEEALRLLRALVDEEPPFEASAAARVAARMGPSVMSAREFFSAPRLDFDASLGGPWPDDDAPEDITETIRQWRREGGYG